MKKIKFSIFFIFLFGKIPVFAQMIVADRISIQDSIKINTLKINPLAPTRAAFYSAILPGLGQAYNKKYWKIPLVFGAIGTSLYFYNTNDKQYNQFREAYKRRLAGFKDDEFYGQYTDATLINAQKVLQRNRDLSLLISIGLYVLNIVDANVDAHLMQFNVNNKLSFQPEIYPSQIDYSQNVGFSMQYHF